MQVKALAGNQASETATRGNVWPLIASACHGSRLRAPAGARSPPPAVLSIRAAVAFQFMRGVRLAGLEVSMFDDRWGDSRDRDHDPRDIDARDREPVDPRDVFMHDLDLPRSDEREWGD